MIAEQLNLGFQIEGRWWSILFNNLTINAYIERRDNRQELCGILHLSQALACETEKIER
jgi:hypothetical protein